MSSDESKRESLEEFKNSFAYGSRTNLKFKFLAEFSDEEAGRFFQGLLWKLGDVFDEGQFGRVMEYVYEWQARQERLRNYQAHIARGDIGVVVACFIYL
ncbi:MAG: hypothetical protein GXO75_01990 [Calditrichaeota bacterium]|nr:hypothetical protein [Calditrichota bacterium]